MQAEAIAKVRDEIDSNKNNPYVQVVGGFLLNHLNEHPEDAEAIMVEGKTVLKSLEAMRKEAEKKKVGNCAVLTDAEGFDIVLKYFKSKEPESKPASETKLADSKGDKPKPQKEKPKVKPDPEPVVEPQSEQDEDDFDFDALLL